jgi:hypothetical protein
MGPPDSRGISRAPRYSGYSCASAAFRVRGFHPLRRVFPDASATRLSCSVGVLLPRRGLNPDGLGCSPVARHYWGNHVLFSLPSGTKMFQFPEFASMTGMDDRPSACRVAPFRHPRVKGRLHLTGAFRSLPRLSSPSRAQASTMCPFLLSPYREPCGSGIYLKLLLHVSRLSFPALNSLLLL